MSTAVKTTRVEKFAKNHSLYSIALPGSKSLSLRAIFIASLASGVSVLRGVADCDDTAELISALEVLGCKIDRNELLLVHGTGGRLKEGDLTIRMGLSGTSTRFLIAMALLRNGVTEIDGSHSLRLRPNKYLIDAIRSLGAVASPADAYGLPVSIRGFPNTMKHVVCMNGDRSSQFFSALLQVAPLLPNGLTLDVAGELVSKPYVDITIDQMKAFGALVTCNPTGTHYRVERQAYKSAELRIEGDASGASYFAALATIHGTEVEITNLGNATLQGDYQFLKICERLGSRITSDSLTTRISGPPGGLGRLPEEIDMEDIPDVAPTLMAIAPLVPGGVRIRGLGTLRIKECDRLAVSAGHLRKLGVVVREEKDRIEIDECDTTSHVVDLEANNDHRIAMSFAVLSSKWGNIRIVDSDCVAKTFPTFWRDLSSFGAACHSV